jgi:alpha-L-rhamnosidase
LAFGLYESEAQRQRLASALHAKLVEDGMRITAGFIGTNVILYALSENGYVEDAYRLLLNKETPSWLYSVEKGATTVWESYDGIKPDGSFRDPSMNSFNHYSHGAVLGWLYQEALGIQAAAPGYQKILLAPKASSLIPTMEGCFDSPVGRISSSYAIRGDEVTYTFEVPAVPSVALLQGKPIPLKPGVTTLRIKNH